MKVEARLNKIAQNLMDQVSPDIRDKTNQFCKEIAKVVDAELEGSAKQAQDAEAKVKAIEKRISKKGDPEEEFFLLRDNGCSVGTWPTLFRASDPEKPLFCIRLKKHPDQPMVCGAHCVGFKVLNDGNVEICNGSIRQIER